MRDSSECAEEDEIAVFPALILHRSALIEHLGHVSGGKWAVSMMNVV